jgi:hypothetical protein
VQLKNGNGFPPVFGATHHCTAAEKAGLEPPSITTAPQAPASVPDEQNRTRRIRLGKLKVTLEGRKNSRV